MKIDIDYSNDRKLSTWSAEVTIFGERQENNFDELMDYIIKKSDIEINCCMCPWEGEEYYGDNFTCDKNDITKGEFMKEIRYLVREYKKTLN